MYQLSVYVCSCVQGYRNYYTSSQSTSCPVYRGIQILKPVVSVHPVQCTRVYKFLNQYTPVHWTARRLSTVLVICIPLYIGPGEASYAYRSHPPCALNGNYAYRITRRQSQYENDSPTNCMKQIIQHMGQ
jgi:hypothetical protein